MANASSGRDIRLDLFRGLALWFIFLDHIPTNVMSWLTVRNYGFSDATEIFVFISGYTAVIAYSRMMQRDGWIRASSRIYRRVWQLYVAHILLFVAFSAQVAWVSIARDTPALIEEMELLGFGDNPYQAILEAALLRFRPVNLDVLPLYIVLLAAFPFVLPAVVRWPLGVIAVSVGLYAATCHFNWNLAAYPDGKVWFFNPMAWQVVFHVGAACAVLDHGSPGSTGSAGHSRLWRSFTFCSRSSSLFHGNTIHYSGKSLCGSTSCSTRSTRPISTSCDLRISWRLPGLSGSRSRRAHRS